LRSIQNALLGILQNTSEVRSERVLNQISRFLEEEVFHLSCIDQISSKFQKFCFQEACEQYFGKYFKRHNQPTEDFSTLFSSGKLYCPIPSLS